MVNVFGKLVLTFFAVYVLFINPVVNVLQEQDEISRIMVYAETVAFLESVTNKGQLSQQALDNFYTTIETTGNIYDVKVTHYKFVLDSGDASGLTGSNYVIYNDSAVRSVLSEIGYYNMDRDDYFDVRVVNKNKTLASQVQDFALNLSSSTEKIFVKYGGVVKNAPY